jgi:hypothetical protein
VTSVITADIKTSLAPRATIKAAALPGGCYADDFQLRHAELAAADGGEHLPLMGGHAG